MVIAAGIFYDDKSDDEDFPFALLNECLSVSDGVLFYLQLVSQKWNFTELQYISDFIFLLLLLLWLWLNKHTKTMTTSVDKKKAFFPCNLRAARG